MKIIAPIKCAERKCILAKSHVLLQHFSLFCFQVRLGERGRPTAQILPVNWSLSPSSFFWESKSCRHTEKGEEAIRLIGTKKKRKKGWKEEEEEDPIPRFPKEEKSKVCSYLLGKKKKRGGEDLMGAEGGKGVLFLPLEGENILFDIRVALGAFFLSC